MSDTTMEERKMAKVSIAKSFKGILRIAHISDVESTNDDNFNNKSLYTTSDNLPKGIQNIGSLNAIPALAGQMTRYNYPNDSLKDRRVPVTDSVGNYLNWNVGLDGVTIGSNVDINYKLLYSYDSQTFPVLKSNKNIIVGLQMKEIKNKKLNKRTEYDNETNVDKNTVTIESSNSTRGMMIINHGDGTNTVYSPSRIAKNNEVIMFRQDDYRNKNYFVDYVNIQEYIKEKLEKYLKGNVMEVPSGMVIYHACSLETWRDDTLGPAMQQRSKVNNYTIQGACKKTNKYNNLLIPMFKRDYLLCDGSAYKIVYIPKTFSPQTAPNLMENRERFFELFFNLGYYYTEKRILTQRPSAIFKNEYYQFINNKDVAFNDKVTWSTSTPDKLDNITFENIYQYITSPDNKKPSIKSVTSDIYAGLDDVDVLFQEDLATMLCCDAIYDYVRSKQRDEKRTPDRNEIVRYLEDLSIPEEYIFNSFIGDNQTASADISNEENKNLLDIKYKTTDGKNVPLKLGREINKFGQTIKFYSTEKKQYRQIKIYKLPRITYFIKLMTLNMSDSDLLQYLHAFYTYNFQVPSFISDDFSPTFIGSGAYMINTINKGKQNIPQSWTGGTPSSIIPHRHFIALTKGVAKKNGDNTFIEYEPYNLNEKGTTKTDGEPYIEGTSNVDFKQNFIQRFTGENLTVSNFVLAEFCNGTVTKTTGGKGGWGINMNDASDSYILRDVPVQLVASSDEINGFKPLFAQTITGNAGNKFSPLGEHSDQQIAYLGENISTNFKNDDPRFTNAEPNRGITDIAVYESINDSDDEKLKLNFTNFSSCTSTSYFSMENVTLLPLIKI